MIEEGEVVDHARPAPVERDPVGLAGLVQVKLDIDVAEWRWHGRQLMQQASFVLARLDCVLLTRQPIDNADAHAGLADAVAQLGREIPLDLLSRESADTVEQWRNAHFGPALGEQRTLGRDGIAWISFAYDHLIGPPIRAWSKSS